MHWKSKLAALLTAFCLCASAHGQMSISNGGTLPVAPTSRVTNTTMDTFAPINDIACGGWTDQGSTSGGPQINAPFTNVFGNREVRATDGCIPGGAFGADGWGGPSLTWWTAYWSPYDPNINGYYFYQQLDDASLNGTPGFRLFILNPQTMTTTPVCASWANCKMPYVGGFSYVTPGLMYYVVGSTGNVCSYDYDTLSGNGTCSDGVGTLVYNMDSCPSLSGTTGWGDITFSHNDQVFQVHTSSISAVYSTAYSKCYWTNPQANTVGGTDNPTPVTGNMSAWPAGIGFHDSVLNPSGQYVWWAPNNSANNTWLWQVYDSSGVETISAPQCTAQSSFCLGHISLGYSHLVFKPDNPQGTPFNAQVPSPFDWGLLSSLATPNSYTHLYPTGHQQPQYNPYQGSYFSTPKCVTSDGHSTWNQVVPGDTNPFVVSSFNDNQIGTSTPSSISCPFDREIDAIATDGSGKTWRLAHNWATGQQNPLAGFDTQYNALSMPICSPDGKYCLWQSDWNASLGTMMGNVSSTTGCSGAYGCNWHASTTYATGQGIIDSNGNEEDVTVAGTSGTTQPAWLTPAFNTVTGVSCSTNTVTLTFSSGTFTVGERLVSTGLSIGNGLWAATADTSSTVSYNMGTSCSGISLGSGPAVEPLPPLSGDGGVTWQIYPGCNTSQTASNVGTCRVDIFVVEVNLNSPPPNTSTLFSTVQAPASPNSGGPGTGLTTAVRWYSDANGYVTGETAYRGTSDTGTWTAALWDNSCNLLASASFPSSAPGWQTATFSTPVPITADKIYMSGHFSTADFYADTQNGQTGTGGMLSLTRQWDAPPLHALGNGGAPLGNSPFVYASTLTCPAPVYTGGGANLFGDNYTDGPAFVASGPPMLPQVVSMSPSSWSTAGGTSATATTSNLAPSGTIQIGNANASYQWNSPTSATVTVPAGSAGPTSANVQNSSLAMTTLQNAGAYTSSAPTVAGVSPSFGPTGGGTSVTISGTNFSSTLGNNSVQFGSTSASCSAVAIGSPDTLTCSSPAGTGTVTVSVTVGGLTGSMSNAFTYNTSGAPTLTAAVTDPGAANASATSVNVLPVGASTMPTLTLTGTNFISGMTVAIGGGTYTSKPCTGVTIASSTSATCTVPTDSTHPETYQNITVTTSNGSASLSNAFFYGQILFQDDFSTGNFSNWNQTFSGSGSNTAGAGFGVANSSGVLQTSATFAGSAVNSPPISANFVAGASCPSAPAIPAGGTYDVCQIYARAGSGSGDSDTYMAEYFSPGLQHYFVRWYVYFQTPTVGSQGYERKVLYTNAGKGLGFSDIPIAWGPASGTNPGQWGFTYDNTSEGGSVPANTCYDGIFPSFNTWYEVEQETQTNSTSPLTQNGYGNQWINGSFACSKSNTWLNGTSTAGSQYFNFGQQISSGNFTGAVTEYRFLDYPVIADAYIP